MVQERQPVDAATFDAWVAEQPEDWLFELVNGEVVEKDMVTKDEHGQIVAELTFFILAHVRGNAIDGYVTGEQRPIRDAALILGPPLTHQAYCTHHSALVVEVIPDGHDRRVRDTLTRDALPGLEIPLSRVFRSG
ncbi:MAG: Uma2 family endonuclease [Anaerolineae bacterium]|nr:Uma2 family endonuclease [Anaerolineae bacterium]